MDHRKVGRYWDRNAGAWTQLARAGYDTYRNHLNTPAFMDMLPDIDGQLGLDIGCGEGYNTRLLAERGAQMLALDIARVFLREAAKADPDRRRRIQYQAASAVELPYASGTFDFVTGFMSFMDIGETEMVVSEAHRVLKGGGFLQFSISHPCFDTPHRKHIRDANGATLAFEVARYFENQNGEVAEWLFSAAAAELTDGAIDRFRIPRFKRTLSQWMNLLLDSGFRIERVGEPRPSDEVVHQYPNLQDAQVVAYFLQVRVRKEKVG